MRVSETPVDMYGRFFVLAHDDAGIGAADEVMPIESAICVNLLHSDPPCRLVTLMRYMRPCAFNTSFGII